MLRTFSPLKNEKKSHKLNKFLRTESIPEHDQHISLVCSVSVKLWTQQISTKEVLKKYKTSMLIIQPLEVKAIHVHNITGCTDGVIKIWSYLVSFHALTRLLPLLPRITKFSSKTHDFLKKPPPMW